MTEEATPSAPPAPTKYDKLLSDAKRANLRELRLTGAIRISGLHSCFSPHPAY